MSTYPPSLTPFFAPQGVAVIGASSDPAKLGYSLARNLVQSGYPGAVHFVNPKGGVLLGRRTFPSIADVPDPLDLAILLIPAPAIPAMLRACGERGLRAAILSSGGFRETGSAGAALEQECLDIAARFNMRLLGPNCIGLLDTHLPLDTTFLPPPRPQPGDIAFISHSGAICAAVIDWGLGQGIGFSRLVSLGNQADVCETDVLAPVADDPFTRVLTLYLEGIRDGRRFVSEAGRISRQKPLLALKVGRFASGQRAVASHTGALAGQESAYDAAFRRAGVIRANTSEEMFDWARALACCPLPAGRNMAVLTNAGGPGVTAADALEANGLKLAELGSDTRLALGDLLPPAASLLNPVDMLASASPEQYSACLRLLLDDLAVDGVLVILPPPPLYAAAAVAQCLIPVIQTASKPVILALMGDSQVQEAAGLFRAARIPEFRFPERAASALAVLAQRAEFIARLQPAPDLMPELDAPRLDGILSSQTSQVMPSSDVFALLRACGVATLPVELAHSAEEAAEIAQSIGFPVALKVASPDISHKSDVGGVLLNLENPRAVLQGYQNIIKKASQACPAAHIEGVHVQRMLTGGQEVIVGAVQDPQFGPLVMFGSGGTEVEGLKDVAFALAPLSQDEAAWMLASTWAGRKLDGYRNLPPADRQAVLQTILRLGQLATQYPDLAEIEINPLRVLPAGEGAFALDVRARIQAD